MQDTISITATAIEFLTASVEGFGNFAAYIDLSNMIAGDNIQIDQYIDVEGTNNPIIISSSEISFDDLQDAGEDGAISIPFAVEADQIGKIGLTLLAGTAPLDVPYRITNLQSGS